MHKVRRSFLVAFSLLAVPFAGLQVVWTVAPAVLQTRFDSNEAPSLIRTGGALHGIKLLSESALLLGGGLVLAILFALPIAGYSRVFLAYIFNSFVKISCIVLGIVCLTHVAIVALICWVFSWQFLHYPPYFLALPILFAAGSAFEVGLSGLKISHPKVQRMVGLLLSAECEPALRACLQSIADRLNANLPANLVIGLVPGIYVRAGIVYLAEKERYDERRLSDGAFYISLPLLSVLSIEEFSALVAHALSDLTPSHLMFAASFVPSVEGLQLGLKTAESKSGLAKLILMPSIVLLRSVIESVYKSFARHQRALCQEADRISADIGGGLASVSGQLRCALLADFWNAQLKFAVEQIEKGEKPTNFGQTMAAEQLAYLNRIDRSGLQAHIEKLGKSKDFDFEPSFLERSAALNIQLRTIRITPADDEKMTSSLLASPQQLDATASESFREILVRSGQAVAPRDPNKQGFEARKRLKRRAQAEARRRSAMQTENGNVSNEP